MFNGIIFNTGKLKTIQKKKNSLFIGVKNSLRLKSKDIGMSISCNGVCLTLASIKKDLIFFYVSIETLKRSNFKNLRIGQLINLEKSLIYGQKISGHFIQGHVDTTAKIIKIGFVDKSWVLKMQLTDQSQLKFLEEKASISINGVSLTISKIFRKFIFLNIIPHTLKLTNFKDLKRKDLVNVEIDIFAKYIYKYNL